MGLYKEKEDVTHKVNVTQKDGKINMLFTADCGKFGTDEIIDEYNITPYELLKVLQGEPR